MRIWRGYIHPHPHPHTQLKKSGIPHTHTHIQSMWGFPSKRERVRTIPKGTGLFAISKHTLIQTVPPVQCSVNDLNSVIEKDQIKHELRK